ncbi:MAG: hypothetical protein HKN80_01245 [Acidimicrobiia bacterium]|nr:hypothetical protein [Acidimicrobiia bacterium]NNC91095.1 hypothetical protein [Acidimicrobiia bacterium]
MGESPRDRTNRKPNRQSPSKQPARQERTDRQKKRPTRTDHESFSKRPARNRPDKHTADGARQSLYVSGLPWATTAEEIHELFGRYGDVHEATIITNRRTGRSRGFGFVEMTRPAADTALGALNGTKIDGRALTIKLARPRAERR